MPGDPVGDIEGFRSGLRRWLAESVPADWPERLAGDERGFNTWWVSAVRDAGYGPPHWGPEVGGPGLSVAEQIVFYEEITTAGAPPYPGMFACAYTHVHDTLLAYGSEEQIALHLPPILAGEKVWAQAFSEPEAGSDLASLRTKATPRGDVYVVNGQKTWSSNAPMADWAILLARTDPDAPKRKGLSYLLVDLHSPGIDIRPIRQMTGSADSFAEIFFDDVEVPAANLVGEQHDGWRVAQATLAAERGPLTVPTALRLRRTAEMAAQLACSQAGSADEFARSAVGQRMAELHTDVEILAELLYTTLDRVQAGAKASSASSVIKLVMSETMQRLTGFGVDLAGIEAQIYRPSRQRQLPTGEWLKDHLGSWQWTIAAGTNEIQRNIIGERVLGLPRDPLVS